MMLGRVKRHLRLTHEMEDESVLDYINWSENDIIEAVYDRYDSDLDIEALELDVNYQKAVTMMAAHYFENRLSISEVNIHEAPFSVTHAIQNLRAHRGRYLKDDEHED